MAANLQSRGLANLVKRFVGGIRSRDSGVVPSLSLSLRSVHISAYDKNLEEHVCATVVPDELIPPEAEQYWAPHPKTGVFGPATDDNPASGGGIHTSVAADSVLEQKAFFRSLEDLEKPVQA